MDDVILITELNDFIFCPISVFFHKLYEGTDRTIYRSTYQINGTKSHETIDSKMYSGGDVVKSLDVYSEEYHLLGKIDIYNKKTKVLTERKKKIKNIYDGYVFQLYAQYFCMKEMGYEVEALEIYSMDDNKKYSILKPEQDVDMLYKFENTIKAIREFDHSTFVQDNQSKCNNCIYEPACDRSLKAVQ